MFDNCFSPYTFIHYENTVKHIAGNMGIGCERFG